MNNVDGLMRLWADDWKLQGRSPVTMRNRQYCLRPFLEKVEELTLLEVKLWLAETEAPETRRFRANSVRGFCKWATSEDLGSYEWWPKVPLPTVKATPQDTVTPKEAHEVLLRCGTNVRNKAIVAVLWSTGVRVGELCRMRIEHLNFNQGQIIIPQSKTGQFRTAVPDPRAWKELHRLVGNRTSGPLFVGQRGRGYGKPLTENGVGQMLRDLKAPEAHAWRRGWATEALRRGVDELSVQHLGGWTSLEMVGRYTKAAREELAAQQIRQRWVG